jgi:hypothetical protein
MPATAHTNNLRTFMSAPNTLQEPLPATNATASRPDSLTSPIPHQTAALIAVFAGSTVLMLFFNWYLRFDLSDDAYIHLRIAHNMIRTGHPYFNLGEPVMVTSSPVWTLVLVLNELVFGARNTLWMWNAIFVALAATAAYWLGWSQVSSRGRAYQVAALLIPITVMAALSNASPGMETPLAVALLFFAAVAFLRSSLWALPLLTLAAFTRYELAIALAAAGLVCLGTRSAWRYGAIPAAVIAGAFAAWLLKEFGTLVPSAVAAKSHVYVLTASDTLDEILPHPLVLIDFENVLLLLTLLLLGLWFAQPLLHAERREPPRIVAIALMLWGASLGLLYIFGKTFIFDWYRPLVWCPIMVGILLMMVIDHSTPRRILALLLLSTLFLNVYAYPVELARAALATRPEGAPILNQSRRVRVYLAAGAILREICPQSQLMTSEIGALGYSFQGYIADGVGIASPEAIKYHPMAVPQERSHPGLGAIPPRFVWERNPDLIFTFDIYGEAVAASPEIHAAYEDLRFYPVLRSESQANLRPAWGARTLHVFVKKTGGCPASKLDQELATILQPETQLSEANR